VCHSLVPFAWSELALQDAPVQVADREETLLVQRSTDKVHAVFATKGFNLKTLQALGEDLTDVAVFWLSTDAQRRTVGDLIVQATEAFIADKEQSSSSARWFSAQRHRSMS
jgi:hypothetical protein